MKAVLKFNIDDQDDDMALKRCHKSLAMALVIWEFVHNGRRKTEDMKDPAEALFKYFQDLLDEHCIIIDELVE